MITKFGLKEGLPQSSVNDIIQTRDGYIWLATFGGLVRFDGNSFTTFNRSNSEGLVSDRILNLHEDRTGKIWISTESGFAEYKDGKFKTHQINKTGQIINPKRVLEDKADRIWILADGTPYFYNGDSFIETKMIDREELVQKVREDTTGVLLGYENKIMHTLNDSIILIKDFNSLLGSEIIDVKEYPKNSGIIYIATARHGLAKYENKELTFFDIKDGLTSNFIKRLFVDQDSTFWVTTYNGISRWKGDRFEEFNPINTDHEINYTKIFKDNQGTFWLGTLGEGVFSAKPSNISTIGKDEGFENDIMLSLSQLSDGRSLFSTNCGGIYGWSKNKLTYSVVNTHLPNLCVWSIFEDSKNRVWFGAEELYRINSTDLAVPGKKITSDDGFNGFVISSMLEDSKENIWIGALNGLFKYDEVGYKHFSIGEGLSSNDVRSIYEDSNGILWVGTISGLNKIKNEEITHVSLQPKSENKLENEPYIRAIYEGVEGDLWMGSYGNGLFRLKDGEVCNITTQHGLFDNIVSHLVKDENENFWMGSNRGIFRVPISSASSFCDGKSNSVQSISYGEEDGMISVETNGGFQPNLVQDSSGNIYFPTVGGVAVVSTRDVKINTIKPPVYIEHIKGVKDDIPITNTIELQHDESFLDIRYTAINFDKPERTRFKFMLEGLNDNWIEVGNRRQALYSKIPPGDYTFKVIASNSDGVWNNVGASLDITVTPPFWNTGWFYALISLLIIGAVGFVYYRRVENLTSENERQKRFTEQLIESQESERRRIASELHDGLGQQILVIKNRVELAKNQVNDPKQITEELLHITKSAEISIQDVRNISHALRPVHLERFGLTEALNNLAEQLQNSTQIEWSYHVDNIDNAIAKDKEINFYRVIQEATNNILKHSNASEATVIVKKRTNSVKAIIWDDGRGFVEKQKKISSLGFLGMKERIETLKGTLDIQSRLMEGTTIKIVIPVISYEKKD
ncbi:hypothetical protein A8B79_11680 [Balneola sp. EhC07]|uniref:ligand-binding sensor domain-containing protein n=1 Tax=Balneola sp. EhC07 TaxID=1849360 RepID=UPI0007F38AE1|nr:sensor histidine kinase [Balneola sp. EhC07]OAN59632.1 hypothetical protein A8B79_11680 [Balneola sp. EhC07]